MDSGKPVLLETALQSYKGLVLQKNLEPGWSNEPQNLSIAKTRPVYIRALLMQEDSEFFDHRGFSLREIKNSLMAYLFYKQKLRGASTLTQQLSRTLFQLFERTAKRKLLELRLARILEERFTKNELLELYINVVWMGFKTPGISYASARLFKKAPYQLEIEQAAFLIALLPRPGVCKSYQKCRDPGILFRTKRLIKLLEKNQSSTTSSK